MESKIKTKRYSIQYRWVIKYSNPHLNTQRGDWKHFSSYKTLKGLIEGYNSLDSIYKLNGQSYKLFKEYPKEGKKSASYEYQQFRVIENE